MKVNKHLFKKLFKEEMEKVFKAPPPPLLKTQCPCDDKNVFSKTSQNSRKIEGSSFNTPEARRFQVLYEIALSLQKKNLAARYFLEGFQRLTYYIQTGNKQEGDLRKKHLEQLIPYFVKARGKKLFVITELNEEEQYWVHLINYNFTNAMSHNMANPHAFIHLLPQRLQ